MAIVHIAMFEAENAITQRFQSYAHVAPVSGDVSIDYAMAQAAHDALVYLYPSQAQRLNEILAEDVARMPGDVAGLAAGQALGQRAAAAIIALRSNGRFAVCRAGGGWCVHADRRAWATGRPIRSVGSTSILVPTGAR